jgi:hypothetical protein
MTKMRKFLLTGGAIAFVGSMAHAQNAPGTSPQPTQSERGPMTMRGMMGGEMPGHEMGEHSMMMSHTSAAIVRIRRGDTSIFIKCADNEPTQACVAAAGTLLDKLNPQAPRP